MSICYFVCGWDGERHNFSSDSDYKLDKTVYLRKNLGQLEKLKHNLDEVVIAIPNGVRDVNFSSYIKNLHIFSTENMKESYGAFRRYLSLGIFYDYYIFIEDDYYFVQDNFEKRLIEDLGEYDYGCSLVWRKRFLSSVMHDHPAISNGIFRKEILEKWVAGINYDAIGQIAFGIELALVGCRMTELPYRCPFWENGIIEYKKDGKEPLIVPYQYLA